ncbi:uncharacterized protein ATC70_001261 [Mucor velutinosus]|uniref:Uncharacterized protein n=1 Tax=Mucor velutinosus TaxID=708070 RepID=A0AAN7I2E6_9FUNG|nr:hypothetical protein ATC70_001261 [Mucor velutinosus]
MNLSDLVHRTAGDNNNKNKVLTPNGSSNRDITNNLRLSQSMNGYSNSHLFQPDVIDPAVSPSNMFTNFARQDQQFLFSMPNTDWVNNNLFFNSNGLMSGQDPLIEPMNQSTSNSDTNNSYMKQNFMPANINHNTSSPTTITATATNATPTIDNNNNNYTQHTPTQQQQQHQHHQHQHQQQQQAKGYPLIAPFQRSIFQNFDLNNGPSAQPPQNLTTHFHKNDHVQFNTNKFVTTTTPASEMISASVATAAQPAIGLPNTQTLTTSNSGTTAETTTATAATDGLQTPKSISEQLQTLIPKPTVKITGDNVTAANIEDGYIQFVLMHDASYISDGIDSLVYAKRKFQSVPKTGDISYTTWDIYQLVLKLHKQEIKNWSQLVGQLGLHDMAGRPQFAQRVKRWMNRYKIDCYFDYLLGNEYQFDAPEGKYSTCLMIGNYKKRKSDNSSNHVNAAANDSDEEELEEDQEDKEQRIPVLLAGSRKRMRDGSHNSLQMIENAQKFLRPHQSETEEEEEDEKEGDEEDAEGEELQGSDAEDDSDMKTNANTDEDVEMAEDIGQDDDNMEEEEEEELAEEEEDELASSTSSPISPARIIIPAPVVNSSPPTSPAKSKIPSPIIREPTTASPNIANVSPAASSLTKSSAAASPSFMHRPMVATSPAISNFSMSSFSPGTAKLPSSPPRQPPPPLSLLSIPPLSSCSNCMANDEKVASMESELSDLRAHVAQLESQLEKRNTQVNKLLRLRDRTERWRKQIISDLARGPQIASDNDDDDDDEDDDDDDDEDDGDDGENHASMSHSNNRP